MKHCQYESGTCFLSDIPGGHDPECELIDQQCQLKPDKPGYVRQLEALKQGLIYQDSSTIPEEDRILINGPVSAHSGFYGNVRLLLFGDVHFSMTQGCDQSCSDIDIETLTYHYVPGCFDIVALLNLLYHQADDQGFYTDTYLEYTFRGRSIPSSFRGDPQRLLRKVTRGGYLPKFYAANLDCFQKNNCSYRNSRFHYVDVRFSRFGVTEQRADQPIFRVKGKWVQFDDIMDNLLNGILSTFQKNTPDRVQKIVDFNILFSSVYSSDLSLVLFQTALTSDDYANRVTFLIQTYLPRVSEEIRVNLIEALTNSDIVSTSQGKVQHRVRKQLKALEDEGQTELARRIYDFVIYDYETYSSHDIIKNLWDQLYQSWVGYHRYESSLRQFKRNLSLLIRRAWILIVGGTNIMDALL